jgi:hypothetical protein
MRILAFSMAAIAASTSCLAAIFLHALSTPTRPRAEFPKSWETYIKVAETADHSSRRDSAPARRAF